MQAEKILHGNSVEQNESRGKRPATKEGKELMLPKLKLRNQSIMHDYLFGSAKKAALVKGKTYK